MNAAKRGKHHARVGEKIVERAERECKLPKAIANENEQKQ
jgi:hypothetical protein